MRTKKVEVVKDRWTDGLALEISHNGWQTTSISNLDVEDLKKIPNSVFKMVDLNQEVEIYLTNLVSTVYFMSIILVNPGRFLKRNLGFLIQLLLVL